MTDGTGVYKKAVRSNYGKEDKEPKTKYFPYPKMGVHQKMFIFISSARILFDLFSIVLDNNAPLIE